MEDTWTSRDLPVLDVIVRHFEDADDEITVGKISELAGMDVADVVRACRTLKDEYVTMGESMGDPPEDAYAEAVSAAARRAVGQWPSGEELVTALVAALDRAADAEPNDDKKSKLRATAQVLGGMAKDIVVQAAAARLSMMG